MRIGTLLHSSNEHTTPLQPTIILWCASSPDRLATHPSGRCTCIPNHGIGSFTSSGPKRSTSLELGYYPPDRQWVTVATSAPATTPSDTASTDQTVRFATIPAQIRLTQLAALGQQPISPVSPPLEPAQQQALAELVSRHQVQPDAMSSAEVGQLVRGPAQQELPGVEAGSLALVGGEAETVSSPMPGPEQGPKAFWLNVNAELIVYGATEPDASVTLGGEPIPLHPDGTFSCHFALPDGEHALTVSAVSAAGDSRQAELHFTRRTDYQGEVGTAPQDPADFSL